MSYSGTCFDRSVGVWFYAEIGFGLVHTPQGSSALCCAGSPRWIRLRFPWLKKSMCDVSQVKFSPSKAHPGSSSRLRGLAYLLCTRDTSKAL
mmetsp:Transcript_4624/g.7216  ORF Transcript_4624/g.7216 Transcript_4624/m.7216 type:complete len:92 (+) Transcript_4624:277-552(+)